MARDFIRRAWIAVLPAVIAAIGLTGAASAVLAGGSKPVIELFTSQGCSSCPPADALLGKYAKRGDVIALTFNVDYWDYLGWKDTLASPKYSARQRSYARSMRNGQVYTPQMVVNGLRHVNGSHRADIESAIAATRDRLRGRLVPLSVSVRGNTVLIEAGAAPEALSEASGTIWLAVVGKTVTVPIKRGENRGKTITYHNVVRELTPIGKWSGEPVSLKLPRQHLKNARSDGCAVLLQQDDAGPILAATELKNW